MDIEDDREREREDYGDGEELQAGFYDLLAEQVFAVRLYAAPSQSGSPQMRVAVKCVRIQNPVRK